MENSLLVKTIERNSPKDPLSLLLANIFLNEYEKRRQAGARR